MRTHFTGQLGGGDEDVEQAGCGTWLGEASNLTGDWGRVDCALCLRRKAKITTQIEAEERAIVEQMGDMAAFMKRELEAKP
jgi:hypothetical protein